MHRVKLSVPPVTSTKITLVKWLMANGEYVRCGRIVCKLDCISPFGGGVMAEATAEIEAFNDGVLHHTGPIGKIVEMGEVIGWIET